MSGSSDPTKAILLPRLRLPLPWLRQPWEAPSCAGKPLPAVMPQAGAKAGSQTRLGAKLHRPVWTLLLLPHEQPGQRPSPSSTQGTRGERSRAGGCGGASTAPGELQEPRGRAGAGGGGGAGTKGPLQPQ